MKSIKDVISEHLNDEASDNDVKRLFEWVGEHPENAEEFARCALLHAQLRGQFSGERLARDSDESASTPSRHAASTGGPSRSTWRYVAVALAVCVLIAAGVGIWRVAGERQTTVLIVVSPVEQSAAATPFELEAEADVIAIASVGKRQMHGGRQIVRVELVDILKGERQMPARATASEPTPLGIFVPDDPAASKEVYQEGKRIAVYLKQNDHSWSALQLMHLGEQEPQWKTRVQSFLEVFLASEAEDPAKRYSQLLAQPPTTKAQRHGLSAPAYFGLFHNPDPRAAPAMRDLLLASISADAPPKALVAQESRLSQQNREPISDRELKQQSGQDDAQIAPTSPYAYATLLARMHDAASVQPVMAHISGLSNDERTAFLSLLPQLCQGADAETLSMVQAELNKYTAKYQGNKQDAYVQTLVAVQASIDKLRME